MSSGYMGFNYKVNSEYSTSGDEFYDGLSFYQNGELIAQFQPDEDGNSSWQYYESFIQVTVLGFMFTVAGDGTREDYLEERQLPDGPDSGW